jgi:hypothetical protein
MKLKDMIRTLRTQERVEIRDEEGYEIITCQSDSKGIAPYLECEVAEWFPHAAPFAKCDFTVYIKEG